MRRAAAAVALACSLLGGWWGIALAHATLVSAEPVAGSRLAAGPTRVRLVFSEAVEPGLAQVALAQVAAGGGRVTPLAVAADPHDVYAVVAAVGALEPGAYRVLWRVVSVDGHPVAGSFVFTAGVATGATAPPPDAGEGATTEAADASPWWWPAVVGAPLVPAALRGVGVGSLMALAGVLGILTLPMGAGAPTPRRAMRLATVLAFVAAGVLALHLAAWVVNTAPDHRPSADWIAVALASGAGRVELWRTGLAGLALWALALARRPGLALGFATAALVTSAGAGHAAAIRPLLAVPTKAVHLLAAAAWLGGLLWLVVRERGDGPAFAREAARVSAIALPAAVLVTLTGVAETVLFVGPPLAAARTAYGVLVLLKLTGLAVLVGFGAHYRARVLPRLARDAGAVGARFGVTLRREVGVMVAVILLGGLLAYVPPQAGASTLPSSLSRP